MTVGYRNSNNNFCGLLFVFTKPDGNTENIDLRYDSANTPVRRCENVTPYTEATINFDPGEWVTKIELRTTPIIRQLIFTTNKADGSGYHKLGGDSNAITDTFNITGPITYIQGNVRNSLKHLAFTYQDCDVCFTTQPTLYVLPN